jgi:hypothetical protein
MQFVKNCLRNLLKAIARLNLNLYQLQQIALLLNTRRDVPVERLYKVLDFTHVPQTRTGGHIRKKVYAYFK